MSNYLLELGAIHVMLILGYWLLLRKERQYQKMRIYLIVSSMLALIIPLLKLPKISLGQEKTMVATIELQPMTVNFFPTPAAASPIWTPELLIYLYLAVSCFFLLRFGGMIIQIIRLEKKSRYEKFHNIYVRKVPNVQGSFTFFNWIFLNEKIDKENENYHIILKHEKAHTSLGHSYDLLFLELFKVCFWWVPTIWFLHKEIRKIHEYQADAYALKSYPVDQYSSILISSTLATHGLSLASSFHDGFIFKRLKAMKQKAKNVSPWKLGTLTALTALLLIAFACSEELDKEVRENQFTESNIDFELLPAWMKTDLEDMKDELIFIRLNQPEKGEDLSDIDELKGLDIDQIYSIKVDKKNQKILIAIRKHGEGLNPTKSNHSGEEIFMVVEEEPEYPEGKQAFYNHVMKRIKYPLEARSNGIEGTVDVQFVIERDGTITEVKAINGIGYGCDEEAVRVVQNVGAFNPGKQRGRTVRVRMVMPIQFKLQSNPSTGNGTNQGTIIFEEVTYDHEKMTVDANYDEGKWTGTIYDSEGHVLPGVNVVVSGTARGTVSNLDGTFSVKADATKELQFSFVGYKNVKLVAE